MSNLSLKDRLTRFLKANYSQAWIASGDLQRIVAEKTDYTPQNVGRRLRELENEGVVEVKYVRGHAHYRFTEAPSLQRRIERQLDWFEKLPEHLAA
jgi:DNA-binding Lrp family transcriptional regulator